MGKSHLSCFCARWNEEAPLRRLRLCQTWNVDGAGRCLWCRYVRITSLSAAPISTRVTGKTTCLDVLAQRKNIGVVTGDIFVDGRPIGADFARGTAYGTPHVSHH